MIALGLRWRDVGSKRLSWRDLQSIVRAAQPGSAIHRVLSPEGAGWSHSDYMCADLIDTVAGLTWVTQRAHGSKAKRPKPYPRPGVTPVSRESRTFGTKPMSLDQMNAWLGWTDRPEVTGRRATTVVALYDAAFADLMTP